MKGEAVVEVEIEELYQNRGCGQEVLKSACDWPFFTITFITFWLRHNTNPARQVMLGKVSFQLAAEFEGM